MHIRSKRWRGSSPSALFMDIGSLNGEYDAVRTENKLQDLIQKYANDARTPCKNPGNPLCKTTKEVASYFSFRAQKLGIQIKTTVGLFLNLYGFDKGF